MIAAHNGVSAEYDRVSAATRHALWSRGRGIRILASSPS